MVGEAAHFFAARAKGRRKAVLVLAVNRLRSLHASAHHDQTAAYRIAVLEHILEADASPEGRDKRSTG